VNLLDRTQDQLQHVFEADVAAAVVAAPIQNPMTS